MYITGNITGTLASSVVYETTMPFTYNGPGINGNVGVTFYTQILAKGISFVTASGQDNNLFTVNVGGTYLIQPPKPASVNDFQSKMYTDLIIVRVAEEHIDTTTHFYILVEDVHFSTIRFHIRVSGTSWCGVSTSARLRTKALCVSLSVRVCGQGLCV